MEVFRILLATALLVTMHMATGQYTGQYPTDDTYPQFPSWLQYPTDDPNPQYSSWWPYNPPPPSQQPFQNPGEILPGLTIPYLINAAGGIWQQARVIDSMAYACTDVLPYLGSIIPVVDQTSLYWGPICDHIIVAADDLDAFNATGFCYNIIDMINALVSPDTSTSYYRYRRQAESSTDFPEYPQPTAYPVYMEDPLNIIGILTNITRDLYGIDINMIINDLSKIDTICINVKENFLRPSFQDIISQFGAEFLSDLLPEAGPYCQDWDATLRMFENTTYQLDSIVRESSRLGAQVVGYDDMYALCETVIATLQSDDDDRRIFSRNIINRAFDILENVDRCTALSNDAINSLVEPLLHSLYGDDVAQLSINYLLYRYIAFSTAGEICMAVEDAFTTEVELPGPEPMELIPGTTLTIDFFVNAAGGLWQQDRLVDTLAYACTDVLPAVTVMVPDVRYFSYYYDPICMQIREAARNISAFDYTGFCNNVTAMLTGLLQDVSGVPEYPETTGNPEPYNPGTNNDDPFGIIQTLINITRELYDIDVNDLSTICQNVDQFLDQPLPGILQKFGAEVMSALLPQAEPICRDWDAFLGEFGLNSSSPYYEIIQDGGRIASELLGYNTREVLCRDLVDAVSAEGKDARLTFSTNIISRVLRFPTDAYQCSVLATEVVDEIVEPLINAFNPYGPMFYLSDYTIYRYTGYRNVEGACQALETAFTSEVTLPRPVLGAIIPGSGLTVSILINLAGSFWEQNRAIDSIVYACTDILPVLSQTIPEFQPFDPYWKPVCGSLVQEVNDPEGFDANGFCLDLSRMLTPLLAPLIGEPTYPPERDTSTQNPSGWDSATQYLPAWNSTTPYPRYQESVPEVTEVTVFSPIIQILLNISNTLGIDITNLTASCNNANDFIESSLSNLLLKYGSEVLSFFLPQAEPFCQNFDDFLNKTFRIDSTSPFYQIIVDGVDIAVQLVGYDTRVALCQALEQALAVEDDGAARLAFSRNRIEELLTLLTDVDKCSTTATDVIDDVVHPIINLVPDDRFYITDDLIYDVTGFQGVRPVCSAVAKAFEGCGKLFDLDSCGECVQKPEGSVQYHFNSDQIDCSGRCPRDNDYGAILNDCGRCVLGATGRPVDAGINECGTCFYGDDSCLGCDGVANSGKVYDACMVCGGDGTNCSAVSSIIPDVIPADTDYGITIIGAGFDPPPSCRFRSQDGDLSDPVMMITSSASEGTCTVSLTAGTYNLVLELPGGTFMNTSVTLRVYDPITIASVAPEEFTLNPTSSVSVTFTAASNSNFQAVAGLTPYLIFGNGLEPLAGAIGGALQQELSFTLQSPPSPMELMVYPSLNGIDRLPGGPFTITFFSPSPEIISLAFLPSGNRLQLEFMEAVRIDNLNGDCSTIFQVTVQENGNARDLFGSRSSCMLIANNRVIMINPGQGDNLIRPGETLTIRGDVIYSQSEFSRALPETIQIVEAGEIPMVAVVLRGASTISNCGDVELSARGSTGGTSRPLTYRWSVESNGVVSGQLEEAVDAISTADLTVDGDLLTENQTYTFSVIAMNFLGGSGSESMVVMRSAEEVPDLTITPRGFDPENVPVFQRFFLDAEVTFYSGCGDAGPEETEFVWTADMADTGSFDDSVHGGTANSRSLLVQAFSFSGGSNVKFTVQARRVGATSGPTSDITISFTSSEPVAVILGGSERSVGVDSGIVTLDGSQSHDPDQPSNQDQSDLVYEWSCVQTTDGTTCESAQDGSTFPAENALNSSILAFDAIHMIPDKTYQFTLEISSGNRRASTSVVIEALPGNPPSVIVSRSGDGLVLSTEPVSLTALIDHTTPVTISWTITGRDIGLDYDLNSNVENVPFGSQTVSIAFIDADILQPGEMYTVEVTVTSTVGSGQTALSQLVLDVAGGVSSCQVSLESGDSYTVLNEIEFLVDNCVTDEGTYPLTYQLLVWRDDAGSQRSLTPFGVDSRIAIIGPPARGDGEGSNTFVIQVCNQHSSCASYIITASVQDLQSFNYEQLKIDLVDLQVLRGDFISALRNINALVRVQADQSTQRRKKRATTTTAQASEQLMLLERALNETVLDVSAATTLLDECPSIAVSDLSKEDLGRFVGMLQTLVSVFLTEMEAIPSSTSQALVSITMAIEEATQDENILSMIRSLITSVTRAGLADQTLGDNPVQTMSGGVTSSAVVALPQGPFPSHSGEGAFTIDFGSDVAERYGAFWACESGSCTGAGIQFDHYSDDTDPYSTNDEDRNDRASAILDITLYDPSSSSKLIVDSLTNPVSIQMLITRPKQGRTYECAFWDTTSNEWSTVGLETVETSETEVECQTTHLSAFVVQAAGVRTEGPTDSTQGPPDVTGGPTDATRGPPENTQGPSGPRDNTGLIIGCVIGVIVALVIIVGLVWFVSKHKKTGSEDKIQGVRLSASGDYSGYAYDNAVYDSRMDDNPL